jgi:predicted Zn-dependent peptidase
MPDYQLFDLPNGIRISHKATHNSRIIHCGFILDLGSRDELPGEEGLAHFLEHILFKGTKKRNAYQIINRLESVGGELNAYTTKEKVCVYASVLDAFFPQAIEILTDIIFNSVFPPKHIEMERGVILEEMSIYEDTPEDAIQDLFDEILFKNHPLGNNILGTRESVSSFQRHHIQEFMNRNLNSGRIIFSVVGNIAPRRLAYFVDKYIGVLPMYSGQPIRKPFAGYEPRSVSHHKPLSQSHCAIGGMAYPISHPKQLSFFVLVNLLGGPMMNSRLNLALREKNGLVYSIEASYQPYIDTGSVGIFFATEASQFRRAVKLVMKELKLLREKKLGTMQLHRLKAQLKGQMAMGEENGGNLMLTMGKSILDSGKLDALEDIFTKLDSLSAGDLMETAVEVFDPEKLSILSFIPE